MLSSPSNEIQIFLSMHSNFLLKFLPILSLAPLHLGTAQSTRWKEGQADIRALQTDPGDLGSASADSARGVLLVSE